MPRMLLRDIVQARSGDKGNTCDLTIFARTPEMYEHLKQVVTAERVKEHFRPLVHGPVTRYEAPTVLGLKFILEDALGGGAPSSLRSDNLGKSFGSNLLRLEIEVPEELAREPHLMSVPPWRKKE
ncbi:MAG: hypothetical protein IMX04_09530 [Candidatus Carbobacillus altaicus]|uniref:Small uncharacterized protein n=1 Tax=Candidatus Carbonibacillus altaicus TaxID=2163959 RepID=A0A2R6Y183_9BACL|nr:hypothetical protein [Candidatus Carbobacillus altaicus]PTQ56431.1 MAG: Small uncharacterized protein [Candidatus Carbobacillus altaicus]